MSDPTASTLDPGRVIAEIPRINLPGWLAQALDIVSRNIELFPPLDAEDYEALEYLYPH